jgi:hypothetical protein
MDLSYLTEDFFWLSLVVAGTYVSLRLLFRKSIVSITDPLNLGLILISFYLSGAFLLLFITPVNRSYFNVLALILIYIGMGLLFSKESTPKAFPALTTGKYAQILFTLSFTALIVTNLVANQIFGIIPLFQGTDTRSELGTVAIPTLALLLPDFANTVLIIFLLTTHKSVRWLAGVGIAIAVTSTVLNGAKSSIINVVLMLCFADYLLHLKRKAAIQDEARKITRSIVKIRVYLAASVIGLIFLLPVYFLYIGAHLGGGGALETLGIRLFGGFDALSYVVFDDIDLGSVPQVHLSEFYFYPFYKSFAHTPDFQSAGEYIVYLATGSYAFATEGLNPNSNFAMELLLSNGSLICSGLAIAAASAVLFYTRRRLLRQGSLRVIDAILWSFVVISPFSLLLDGTYFVIRLYELMAIYLVINLAISLVVAATERRWRLFN